MEISKNLWKQLGERSHQNLGFLCLRLLCNSPVNGSDADELCWPIVTPLVFFSIKSTTWSKNIWLRSFRSRNWCAAIQGSSTDSNEDSWVTHVQRKHFISSFTPHNLSQLSQNFCVILTLISSGKSNLFQVVSPHCKFASTAFASSLPNVNKFAQPLPVCPQNVRLVPSPPHHRTYSFLVEISLICFDQLAIYVLL